MAAHKSSTGGPLSATASDGAASGDTASSGPSSYSLYFEDFEIGMVWEFGNERLVREEMIEFSRRYDPEPMHTDELQARETPFGGLIASGLQTVSLWRRMDYEHFTPLKAAFIVSGGFENLRWVNPGRPGDVLRLRCECTEKIALKSKSDRGIVKFDYVMTNQEHTVLLELRNVVFVYRRPAGV